LGVYFGFTDPEYFDNEYTREDGTVEWSTSIMLLFISILCFSRLFTLGKVKPFLWKLGVLGFALLFLFGAGEEISWGQRLLDIESSDFFKENNAQEETNLHNLIVGETKLNKLIFSQLLMIIMLMYLVVSPIIYRKKEGIRKLFNTFAVPLVKWHHTIAFVLCTAIVLLIPSNRKWELYELAFGVIFLLIFMHPFNAHIFKKTAPIG
jgi:hypothetical protein